MKELELPQKVLAWCKDGKHYQCNKVAWRIFYHMIAYHAGMLEELIEKKQLGWFTDLPASNNGASNTGRNAIMINSIHYIGKLFTMLALRISGYSTVFQPNALTLRVLNVM